MSYNVQHVQIHEYWVHNTEYRLNECMPVYTMSYSYYIFSIVYPVYMYLDMYLDMYNVQHVQILGYICTQSLNTCITWDVPEFSIVYRDELQQGLGSTPGMYLDVPETCLNTVYDSIHRYSS